MRSICVGTETTDPELEVILWTPSFETGLETIDAQHQQLVRRVNQLAARFGEGPSAAPSSSHRASCRSAPSP
jgi:hypothetical protein